MSEVRYPVRTTRNVPTASMASITPLVLLAAQGLVTPACAQDEVSWISPVSGLWSEASNWSSAPVPGLPGSENRRVNIALAGTYTVDLDFNATISGIELVNSNATLRFSGPSGALTTTGDNRFAGANIAGSGSNTLTTGGLTVFSGGATIAGISAANFGGRTEFTGDDIDLCDTCVFLTGDAEWTGGGSFNLENDSIGSEIVIETGGSLALTGAGARTIRGIGANNRVINRGELRVALDAGADALAITDSQFQNVRGASVRIETGTLQSNLSGSLSGNSLRGGDWFVGDAGTVDTMGVQIEAIDVAVELDGAGSAFDAVNALERVASRGALRVKNGRDFATAAGVAFSVQGELEVGDGSAFMVTDTLANLNAGTLQGGSFLVGGEFGLMNGGAIGTLEAGLTLQGAGTVSDGAGGDLLAGLARVGVDGVFALRSGAAFTTASDLDLDGTLDIGAGSAADVQGNLSAFQTGVFGNADLRVRGELIADNSRVEAVEGALLVGLDGRILARDGAGTVDGLSFLRQVRVDGSVELAEGRDLDVRAAGNTVEIEGDLILGATGGSGPDALLGSVFTVDGIAFEAGSSLTTTIAAIDDFGRIDALSAMFGMGGAGETAGDLVIELADGYSVSFGDRFLLVAAGTVLGDGFASITVDGMLPAGFFFEQFVDGTGVGVRVVPAPAGLSLVAGGLLVAGRRRR